jgi:Macrocin-O-methyltransferase (TylF)
MPLNHLPDDFDKDDYLHINPDVAAAGVDPAMHYMQTGHDEGRSYKPMSALLKAKLGEERYEFDGLHTAHNHDFMLDERFKRAYQRGVKAAGKDYQWHWRVHIGLWAAATAIKLPGDFVECGVNRGFLSSAIMQQHDWDKTNRMFYLLDTFQGIDAKYLSELEIKGGVLDRNQSEINSGFYTQNLKEVEDNFAEWKNKKIVVGSIPETLPYITSEKIAFLHIDLNCTEPEVAALDYLWPKLVCGAVVVLDDYAYYGYQLQKQGMDEWAKLHDIAIASLPTGQGLIIKTTENI